MRFDRRRLFGLFGAAAVAPVVAKLPAVEIAAYGHSVAADALPDLAFYQRLHFERLVNPPMVLGETDTGVFFRGIPIHVVDELKDGRT